MASHGHDHVSPEGEGGCCSGHEDMPHAHAGDEREYVHWKDVSLAFRDYCSWFDVELRRRDTHFRNLRDEYRAMLPAKEFTDPEGKTHRVSILQYNNMRARAAMLTNQRFLDFVAQMQEESGFADQWRPFNFAEIDAQYGDKRSSASHFSKIKSTLHTLVRDWSKEGAGERESCYGPIIAELAKVLPVTPRTRNTLRVCVPGCGLGRLVFDLALLGYAAQGNEFSYFMLFVSHVLLNCTGEAGAYSLHPWIHDTSNHLRADDMLRSVDVPDVNPSSLLDANPGADFSMVAGDFIAVYSAPSQKGMWDAVATCFFLDTAPVVFEYIDTIWYMLKEGGVWVNNGPLLYHWQNAGAEDVDHRDGIDDRYLTSIELTYEEIRYAILTKGFQFTRESSTKTFYSADALSLMKTLYTTVLFTAVKSGPESSVKAAAEEAAAPSVLAPAASSPAKSKKKGKSK